ncbi:MAG TPA: phytanoyl-CoA dioxygenase family protein [Candidatus Kryptonia bacterium]|nr:phytanoyl-CoA dioxygenase family protein [Candidatus Kryptonia bacterium]
MATSPERHPWNRSFTWQPRRVDLRRITEVQAQAYDEQGFFVLEDAFDPTTVQRVLDAIDPLDQQTLDFLRTQERERFLISDAKTITFTPHLVLRSPVLRGFCAGQVFRDLVHDLIGDDVRLYWDQAVYKRPEQPKPFPWHQDNGYTYVEPQQYLTCWVALTDATEQHGCPWVVPGMHRMGTLRHRWTDLGFQCLDDPAGAVPVPARAGSIVVFSSLTPHCTGPNLTNDVRKTYIVQFAPDGARALRGDQDGAKPELELQNHPERQFLILRGGQPPCSRDDGHTILKSP